MFAVRQMTAPLDIVTTTPGGIVSTPVYWSERNWIYVFAHGGHLHRFELDAAGRFVPAGARIAADAPAFYGPLSLAKRRAEGGVIWCIATTDPQGGKGDDPPGWLRAYNADTLESLSWPINLPGSLGENLTPPVRFTPPTPANGKVYVGAETAVHVFGFRHLFGLRGR